MIRTSILAVVLVSQSAYALPAFRAQQPKPGDTTVVDITGASGVGVGRLVEKARVGGAAAAREYQFTNIVSAAPTGDAGVLVIDRTSAWSSGTASVRMYDSSGRYIRSFGRLGQGPGEYTHPGGVAQLPDGRVALSDIGRVNIYSRTGAFLASWPLPIDAMLQGPPLTLMRDGTLFASFLMKSRDTRGVAHTEPLMIHISATGQLLDTVRYAGAEFPNAARMDRVNIPFIPTYLSAFSPAGYFVTAYTERFAVDLRRGAARYSWKSGDRVVSVRKQIEPVAVLPAERSDWRRSLELFMLAESPGWQWNGPVIPTVKPVIRNIVVWDDGQMWVQLHQRARLNAAVQLPHEPVRNAAYRIDAPHRWPEAVVYEVLDASGGYVGRVEVPDNVHVRVVSGNNVWGVVKDADDVPSLRRYTIQWSR